jgi:hypothetical protein
VRSSKIHHFSKKLQKITNMMFRINRVNDLSNERGTIRSDVARQKRPAQMGFFVNFHGAHLSAPLTQNQILLHFFSSPILVYGSPSSPTCLSVGAAHPTHHLLHWTSALSPTLSLIRLQRDRSSTPSHQLDLQFVGPVGALHQRACLIAAFSLACSPLPRSSYPES